MDPLSIIASIIAISSFATASLNVILKIRGASDEVQALINEISDLSAIIKDVEHTLRYNKRLNAESNGVATLHAVLSKANITSARIGLSVANVVALSDNSRTSLQAQASDVCRIRNEVQKLRQLVDSKSRWESSNKPFWRGNFEEEVFAHNLGTLQ